MHQKIKSIYLFVFMLAPYSADATHVCPQWIAKIVSLEGKVDSQFSDDMHWHTTNSKETFCRGDKIRTDQHSRATLLFKNESRATLNQNTTLTFIVQEKESTTWYINLFEGGAFFRSRQPQRLNIHTPFINAVHEGTEFLVTVDSQQTQISVFDGQVAATNQMGKILIKKGYTGIAQKDLPPSVQALKIRPEDAVQWTLYYPPIVDIQTLEFAKQNNLQSAINAYQQGDIFQALTLLNKITIKQQNCRYLTLKASLLLTVGRVDEALPLIDKALFLQPNNSHAFALQAIIAVAKNRQDSALNLAQKAVTANPKSAVAQIALSYAYQSSFNIESALEATQQAVHLSPDNALAWARLAELQLSTGERSDALESAQKAQALNPGLGHTQTILGFTYLSQVDIDEAKIAFTKAINLNSADPLARLGLGLAKIRQGDIEEGTSDIETAVSLDPENAIMRSYLGKAYYELRNDGYAETELTIAKEMDPNDPTPWFYDAIRKQTTNRPVEALHDMQKAIELNDNRGVYRSKLLLDEDAAARSANMARIYQDLGFDRVALKHAWTSLGQDYTNPSAHRFLSDTLQGKPRQRIARASELLQAQLFQPINTVPVQPQLTSENIGILNSTGPGSLSSNEYDPLFTSNGAHILLNGAYGSNNTLTDSAIISGVYDQLSLSLGQFHYQTDGFRNNDGYQQDIYNAFIQYAVTPDFNFQFEFKTEDIRNGDVPFRLNDFHRENFTQAIEQDTARVGVHYHIDSKQDVLVSTFYTTRKEKTHDISQTQLGPFLLTANIKAEGLAEGYQAEIQYLFHPGSFDITTGLGYLDFDQNIQLNTTITPLPIPPEKKLNQSKIQHFNAYIYSKQQLLPNLTSIIGLSFDSYRDSFVNRQNLNPKVGLLWNPLTNLTLRSSVFRTLKRPLAANQTIEPTQIAGFNQFFDGNNGTSTWSYSLGADYQPIGNLFLGGEINWRYNDEPFVDDPFDSIGAKTRNRNEASHLAFLYWTLTDWFSFKTEYHFDKNTRDFIVDKGNLLHPQRISTHQIPFSVNLFHSSGIFARLSATYVKQKVALVTDSVSSPLEHDKEQFWTFNTSLGYRIPKKLGLISLEVRNIFNHSHSYQSSFNASGPQISLFTPEREIFVKLNLSY
ncbi:MAG: FecR domain-containing protein [Methylococcaceae bacterium]|nr:FecR domain-containing protein [Methylococcaceae bacterium]